MGKANLAIPCLGAFIFAEVDPTVQEGAQKLSATLDENLNLFDKLLVVCDEEFACFSQEEIRGLEEVLAKKEVIIKRIEENGKKVAPLWERIEKWRGDEALLDRLNDGLAKIRESVEKVQLKEAAVAEGLARRSQEVGRSLGTLHEGGKALRVYRPVRTFAPCFVDKRE